MLFILLILKVRMTGFEPVTYGLEVNTSDLNNLLKLQ